MNLLDLIYRDKDPEPWAEGEKIPWDDPDFSLRMLQEHLTQEHDAASRRFALIDQHVDWIHQQVLAGEPTRVLDLGCGPGLYTSRLARLGHECVGIDFSPASIAYAKKEAQRENLACTYHLQDLRLADYGDKFGLVMSIFGEFNVFRPKEAQTILDKAYTALRLGGALLLEPHTYATVMEMGQRSPAWYSAESGLFSTMPHLVLQENFWDADQKAAIERFYVVAALSGEVTSHSASIQAYSEKEYRQLLAACGFKEIDFYPNLGGVESGKGELFAILARK